MGVSDHRTLLTEHVQPGSGGSLFGVGLRRPHFSEIFDHHPGVDFVEIVPENFMRFGGRMQSVLARAKEHFPIVAHGVSLSVGSVDPFDEDYLNRLKELCDTLEAPFFSDHFCYSSAMGTQYHDLIPMPFNHEAIEHLIKRILYLQDRLERPAVLENPSYYVRMPESDLSEAEFLSAVIEGSGCGMLLDINNIWVNAQNHNYDASAFLKDIPHNAVAYFHMAGHDDSGPFIVDTHGAPLRKEVLELYQEALKVVGPRPTLLEWDNNIPSLDILLAENEKLRTASAHVLNSETSP